MHEHLGKLKNEFNERLGGDWGELCDLLEIKATDRERLRPGHRGSGIWEWLENRALLHTLPSTLVQIGRVDLSETLRELGGRGFDVNGDNNLQLTWQDLPYPPTKLPRTGDHLIGRDNELEKLSEAWNSESKRLVQIVAPGGVGKTQLIKKWRERLLDEPGRSGAVRAFDWSFYSQGTQQQSSADDFFDKALRWFGEPDPTSIKDQWSKGERLAQLVQQNRTLLILDGMEPLQHPPGPLEGELTDPGVKALLRGLGENNPGLCVVTTRETVPDIADMGETRRLTIDLTALTPGFGAQLLREYGINGDDEELRQASRDVQGHALTLILLGTFLKARFDGDVTQRNEVLFFEGSEKFARHARKVIASYVRWFETEREHDELSKEDPLINRAAVSILRLMGLFNRPADEGCLNALRAEPPIRGLTDALFEGDRDDVWRRAIERLRGARLLTEDSSGSGMLDAHPLIREHFAAATEDQLAYQDAHRRLYEHLKQSTPEFPENLKEMIPLYHAITHGCKSGMHEDAMFNVLVKRIWRGNEVYSLKKMGAFGTDLAAAASFFHRPFSKPSQFLSDENAGALLNMAGFQLRGIGRLRDSLEPLQSATSNAIEIHSWKQAAPFASNLSELSLTLGEVSAAVRLGEQCVELADRSGDDFKRVVNWTTLAAALHAAAAGQRRDSEEEGGGIDPKGGPVSIAESVFQQAESLQQKIQPQFPRLYSQRGYEYCNLLLDRADCLADSKEAQSQIHSVRERASETLRIAERNNWLLDQGLDNLTLGRTYLAEAVRISDKSLQPDGTEGPQQVLGEDGGFHRASEHLNQAVNLLRQAGQQPWIPLGLLHRAALWRSLLVEGPASFLRDRQGENSIVASSSEDTPGSQGSGTLTEFDCLQLAEKDLIESESISERSSIGVFQIEAALERSRLYIAASGIPSLCFNSADQRVGTESQRTESDWLRLAREKLVEAKQLVQETEKPYEPHVPDWDAWERPEYVGVFKKGNIVGYHCRNDEIERLEQFLDDSKLPPNS